MSAIDQLFERLRAQQRKALMPFVTAGDPDLDFTAAVIREMIKLQQYSYVCAPQPAQWAGAVAMDVDMSDRTEAEVKGLHVVISGVDMENLT